MQRATQSLRTVNVGETWWICNDGIGNERHIAQWVRFNASLPTSLEHFCYHLPLLSYILSSKILHVRDETRVLDHVGHELGWVTADGIELKPGLLNEFLEDIVRC
jgi:hypothetical protein